MALLCFVTCRDEKEARKIAEKAVEKRLAACANIIPSIESHYRWRGKLENASEAMLILKTRENLREQLSAEIKKIHSYELPAIEFIEAGATTIGDLLYNGTQFECVTCHDVHNSQNEAAAEKFLWISNDHSAFCLTCHLKDGTTQTQSATAGPATGQ